MVIVESAAPQDQDCAILIVITVSMAETYKHRKNRSDGAQEGHGENLSDTAALGLVVLSPNSEQPEMARLTR